MNEEKLKRIDKYLKEQIDNSETIEELEEKARIEYFEKYGRYPEEDGISIMINK